MFGDICVIEILRSLISRHEGFLSDACVVEGEIRRDFDFAFFFLCDTWVTRGISILCCELILVISALSGC